MCNTVKSPPDIKRVVVSLPTFPRDVFSVQFVMDLTELVNVLRPMFRRQNYEGFDKGAAGKFMASSRFNDSDQCAKRALGTIWHSYGFYIDQINDVAVPKEKIQAVERQEWPHLGTWAWEALRNAAMSDHWYYHEKVHE